MSAIRNGSVRGLFGAAGGKLLLVRRSIVSGPEGRVGNMRLPLHSADFDKHFNIHISRMVVPEFGRAGLFQDLNPSEAVRLNHGVCEGENHCDDGLPPSVDIPFMTHDLLLCNRASDNVRVFVFSDGLLVTDMRMDGDNLPVGPALFIAKDRKGYRLAGLIAQH